MGKEISFDKTMGRMLDTIPDEFDKRETSIIYQAVAMVVPELMTLQSDIELLEDEAFPDTCNHNNLIRFSSLRNIHPRPATRGTVIAEFNMEVEIGTRFNCEERNYEVIEKIESNKYKLVAEETGHIESIGDLTPIDDMPDLRTAKITSIALDGRDGESAESLRKRYMESLDYQAFGGNRADYIDKVTAIDGIGTCKVFRRPKSTSSELGRVKIYILDNSYKKASTELIKLVNDSLNPEQGEGYGLAPIGHMTEVFEANKTSLNISMKLTLTQDTGDIMQDIKTKIDEYLQSLREDFGTSETKVVRISRIENKILDVTGVVDITGTKINGLEKNLVLDEIAIPILGEVTYDRI